MRCTAIFLIAAIGLFALITFVVSPPPKRQGEAADAPSQPNGHVESNGTERNRDSPYNFPYFKYLEQVVKILELQPALQERIRSMDEEEIKTGKVADHIDDLGDEVFEQLTKAKIEEINRLREEFQKQIDKEGDARNIKMPDHLDLENLNSFKKEDLRKLIVKTFADMNEIDEKRRAEFKEYEMRKQAEKDHRLAQMSPEEREKELVKEKEMKKHHAEHEKVNHPGGRQQLEEVWEERDHMDKNDFNLETFFALHDLNSDGYWNAEEIEALFQIELEKVYNETDPADDPKEKIEEMYQMREHLVKQMDKDNNGLISMEEFLQDREVQSADHKDEGWQDISEQQLYTDEELKKFEQEYAQQQKWGEHAYDLNNVPGGHHPSEKSEQNHQNPPVDHQKVPKPIDTVV